MGRSLVASLSPNTIVVARFRVASLYAAVAQPALLRLW
jgi:hypothetical protein